MAQAISEAPAAEPSSFRARPLAARDAGKEAALIRAAFAAQSASTGPPPSALRETADTVRAQFAFGQGGGFGAKTGGRFAGVVPWAPAKGGMRLGRLAVAPDWRGRGAAQAPVAPPGLRRGRGACGGST